MKRQVEASFGIAAATIQQVFLLLAYTIQTFIEVWAFLLSLVLPLTLTRIPRTLSLPTMSRLFKFGRRLSYDGYLIADTLLTVTSYATFGFLVSKIPDTHTKETKW
jgi:hypothetical protein